jgi:hypothetical protein
LIAAIASSVGAIVVELLHVEVWGASGVLKFCRAPRQSVRRANVHVTVPVHPAIRDARQSQNTKIPNSVSTSTRCNSTNMEPIDAALAAIKLLGKGEHCTYTKIAD